MSLTELNEKYKEYPTVIHEYEIGGKKYRVHSHFVATLNVYCHQFQNSQVRVSEAMDGAFGFLNERRKEA